MMSNKTHSLPAEPVSPPRTHRVQALLITCLLTLTSTLPLILSGNANGRAAADDYNYHWIAIQKFAIEWPSPDLSDYASATTPGYHLLLAPMVSAGMTHTWAQLVAMLWTLGFFGLLCWYSSRSLGRAAVLFCLPLIVSMYTMYPGVWLLPDNAGWLIVLVIMLIALREQTRWVQWLVSGALLVPLVLMRQIHIWIAATIWLGAWLGADGPAGIRSFFSHGYARSGRALIAIGFTIPGFAMLLWFMLLWGGLVPPMFQGQHQGPNPATPGFILLQLGILSMFFAPALLPRFRDIWAHHWRWVLLSITIGLVLAVVPASSYSVDAGRYSGWWNFVKLVPSVGERSLVFMIGAIVGSAILPVWLSMVSRRDAWIWAGTLIAFTLAQSMNHASWQRYHEPMLLVMIVLIVSRSSLMETARVRVMVGTLVLSGVLAGLTIMSLVRAEPYTPIDNPFETRAQLQVSTPVP